MVKPSKTPSILNDGRGFLVCYVTLEMKGGWQ